MNRARHRIEVSAALALTLAASGLSQTPLNLASQKPRTPAGGIAKVDPLQKPPVLKLCSDLACKLTVQKNPDGSFQLTGRISNEGPGNYSDPSGPLDAFFMVYTWHPPKTPAQEGDLKLYGHTLLGTALKAKEVKTIQFHYQIEKFSRWGSYPLSATERPAMKQVCVRVERKSATGFSKCEDSNLENTTDCTTEIPYMEKLQ